jgi:hypothetical protein
VQHDGELWQAVSLAGKVLFRADTEEEAADAARAYLELTCATHGRVVIQDVDLTLEEGRREQIQYAVVQAL